ncbi:MAG: DUF4349 domain-containing protein, partial [Spirochaetales bacterium]
MKKFIVLAGALVLALAALLPAEQENYLHYSFTAQLIVADPDKASQDLGAWCELMGGYFVLKSSDRVIMRFPYSQNGRLLPFLDSIAEEVLDFSPQAVDLREELLGLTSAIQSREEILSKNLAFIDKTTIEGTLAIEKEVMQLLSETEELKGKLNRLNGDRIYARADISLRYLEKKLPSIIPSSFAWLNGIDFYKFIKRTNMRIRSSLAGIKAEAPEGFAVFNKGRGRTFMALSPEGALYTIYRINNYPRMDLAFWTKALQKQLSDSGYRLHKGPEEFTGPEEKGVYFEWIVPYQG